MGNDTIIDFDKFVKVTETTVPTRIRDVVKYSNTSPKLCVCALNCLYSKSYRLIEQNNMRYSHVRKTDNSFKNFRTLIYSNKNQTMKKTKFQSKDSDLSLSLTESSQRTNFTEIDFNKINFKKLVKENLFDEYSFGNINKENLDENKRRNSIFWKYNSYYNFNPPPENFELKFWEKEPISQFLFSQVKFEFPFKENLEPFFCRAALYDLNLNKRISEFFDFDFSKEDFTHFLFYCEPSPEIVLVIHIDRIYQKDIDQSDIPYYKNNYQKSNDQIFRTIKSKLDLYKNFTQNFAWCYTQLFNDYGEIKIENRELLNRSLDKLYIRTSNLFLKRQSHTEEDFINLLNEIKTGGKLGKEFDECYFVFELKCLNEEAYPSKRISRSMLEVKPSENKLNIKSKVKEVDHFSEQPEIIPETEYQNTLYVYPFFYSLPKHRNIMFEIYFRNRDSKNLEKSEAVFISKNTHGKMDNTSVFYGTKSAKLNREWRINIPTTLDSNVHLLLIFYQINSRDKKKGIKEYIGYAYLKLIDQTKTMNLIESQKYELKIDNRELKDGYLSSKEKIQKTGFFSKNIFKGNIKNFVRLSIKLNSSVMSSDFYLNNIFSESYTKSKNLNLAIKTLNSIKKNNIIKFLPPIFERMIGLLVLDDEKLHNMAVKAIVKIISILNECTAEGITKYDTENLLKIWKTFYFYNYDNKPLYIRIIKALNYDLTLYEEQEKNVLNSSMIKRDEIEKNFGVKFLSFIESIWFWLSIIVKSLKLKRVKEKEIKEKYTFLDNIVVFVSKIATKIEKNKGSPSSNLFKNLINALSDFVKSLFLIYNSSDIYKIVKAFSDKLIVTKNYRVSRLHKTFLITFYQSEFYTEVIRKSDPSPIGSMSDIKKNFSLTYHLIQVSTTNLFKNNNINYINVLVKILCKHDYNEVFDSSMKIQAVANVYFPLIEKIVENKLDAEAQETKEMLICSLWLLKNCSQKMLIDYLKGLNEVEIKNFLYFIELSLEYFKYVSNRQPTELLLKTTLSQETEKSLNVKSQMTLINEAKSELGNATLHLKIGTRKIDKEEEMHVLRRPSISRRENSRTMNKVNLRTLRKSMHKNIKKEKKNSYENFYQMVEAEGKLTEVVYDSAFGALEIFIENFYHLEDLTQEILGLVLKVLGYTMTKDLYLRFYNIILYYFLNCPNMFCNLDTKKSLEFIEEFIAFVMQYSISPNPEIMEKSCFFIYYVPKIYCDAKNDFSDVKKAMIKSLYTKGWVLNIKNIDIKICSSVIEQSVGYLNINKVQNTEKFSTFYNNVVKNIMGQLEILSEIVKLQGLKPNIDNSYYEERLLEIANHYRNSPIIRLNWIKKLMLHHNKIKNYPEAAKCVLEILRIIKEDFGQERTEAEHTEEGEIEKYSIQASELLYKCSFYEESVVSFTNNYVPVLMDKKDYRKLILIHKRLSDVYRILDNLKKEDYRDFGLYYKVFFYGKSFGKSNKKSYIYRTQYKMQIEEFCDAIIKHYYTMTGRKVNIIPENTKESTLDENDTYVKVICVSPNVLSADSSRFDKECNKNTFCYEMRYVPEGTKVKGTGKKISFLTKTPFKFPFLITRQEIISTEYKIHSAIKVATDDIKKRVDSFKRLIDNELLNFLQLESILSGSVLALVNGGIKNYFDDFYNDNVLPTLNRSEVFEFEKVLRDFMKISKYGIEIYLKYLIKSNLMEEKKVMYETLSLYYLNTSKLVSKQIRIDE